MSIKRSFRRFRSHAVTGNCAAGAAFMLAVRVEALHRRLVDHGAHTASAASPSIDSLTGHFLQKVATEVVAKKRAVKTLECGM